MLVLAGGRAVALGTSGGFGAERGAGVEGFCTDDFGFGFCAASCGRFVG